MQIMFSNENEMMAFASKLAKLIENGTIIFLQGPLGSGKTTFTRGFLRGLGYENKVKSPTYSIIEPYETNEKKVFHFDFYRLKDANELEQIGIRDYFSKEAICLIEWPENGGKFLPKPDLTCKIAFNKIGRELLLEPHSQQGEAVLNQLTSS